MLRQQPTRRSLPTPPPPPIYAIALAPPTDGTHPRLCYSVGRHHTSCAHLRPTYPPPYAIALAATTPPVVTSTPPIPRLCFSVSRHHAPPPPRPRPLPTLRPRTPQPHPLLPLPTPALCYSVSRHHASHGDAALLSALDIEVVAAAGVEPLSDQVLVVGRILVAPVLIARVACSYTVNNTLEFFTTRSLINFIRTKSALY